MTDFKILHLTDLHMRPMAGASLSDDEEYTTWAEIIQQKCEEAGGVDLLVFSGDITDRGDKTRLNDGLMYLEKLRVRLSDTLRIVLVPGNHDATWPNFSEDDPWSPRDRFGTYRAAVPNSPFLKHLYRPPLADGERAFPIDPNFRWWIWDESPDSPNVFVLPLCSADHSGEPRYPSLQCHEMWTEITAHFGDKAGSLQSVLSDDIPYVHQLQLERFSEQYSHFQSQDEMRARFDAAVKIAVLHHPPFPVLAEQEHRRPYDSIANGTSVLSRLSEWGFHLVLYGHKHLYGLGMNFGYEARYVDNPSITREMAFVAGGHCASEEKNKADLGFSIIEIRQAHAALPDWREVQVARHSLHDKPQPVSSPIRIMTIDHDGNPRWIFRPSEAGMSLSRTHTLSYRLSATLQSIERSYLTRGKESELGETDDLVDQKLQEAEEYGRGPKGVDESFVELMVEQAARSSAMVFVDLEGGGTWSQPDLLRHLLVLFRLYHERNAEALREGKWEDGAWRFGTKILEDKMRDAQARGNHHAGSAESGSGRKDTTTVESTNAEPLKLDLLRILLWPRRQRKSIAARALAAMHEAFDVRLLWCDRELVEAAHGLSPADFHVLFTQNCDDVPSTQQRSLRHTPSDLGAEYWVYRDEDEKRVPITDDNDLDGLKALLNYLLNHAELIRAPADELAAERPRTQSGEE